MEIKLTKGYVAVVDDDDGPLVSRFNWHVMLSPHGMIYAATDIGTELRNLKLHQLVFGAVPSFSIIDHRDRDGLNCRKSNHRAASSSQSNANQGIRKDNTSGFKGVSVRKKGWRACL